MRFTLSALSLKQKIAWLLVALLMLSGVGTLFSPRPVSAQEGEYIFIDITAALAELVEDGDITTEQEDHMFTYVESLNEGTVPGIGLNCTATSGESTCEAYFVPIGASDDIDSYTRVDFFFDEINDGSSTCFEGVVQIAGDSNPRQGIFDSDCTGDHTPVDINISGNADNPAAFYQGGGVNNGQFWDVSQGGGRDPEEPPDDEAEEDCESRNPPFGWILCSVVTTASEGLIAIQEGLDNGLNIDDEYYDQEEFRQGWATIRNLAYILLVPVTLVMVIGTAIGFDFISAYTVKRALPRLVIAVMGIALSYELCVFMIEFFNTLGRGAFGLVTAAFPEARELTLASLIDANFLDTFLASAAILLVVIFAFVPLLVMILTGFVVIVVRQMLIIGLILASPVALIGWIFPANQKLWNTWWGMFTRLLVMYPLMMMIIGVGRVFARLIQVADEQALTPFTSWASLVGIERFAQLEDTPLIGDMMPAVALVIFYALAPIISYPIAGGVITATAGAAGAAIGGFAAKRLSYLSGLRQIKKDEKKKQKMAKRERKIHDRIHGKTDPGWKGWKEKRNAISQFNYLRKTGQLGTRRFGIGPRMSSPLTKKGRGRLKDKMLEMEDEGKKEAIEHGGEYVGGDDAGNWANERANNEKEWIDRYIERMPEEVKKGKSRAELEDIAREKMAAHVTAAGAEVGSRALKAFGRHNLSSSATSTSTDKSFDIEAQRKMFGEFFLPYAQAVADGRMPLMQAAAEIIDNAKNRPEFSHGEWTDVSGMLETAVDNLQDESRGVKADGSNAEQLFDNEDIEKKMTSVLGEGNVLELTGGNYRSMYPIADAHRRRIQAAHARANDANLSDAERQKAQDDLDRYLAQTVAFADRDDIPDREKEILADGVHNVSIDGTEGGQGIWDYAQGRRQSKAFRQAHLEYGGTDDTRESPVPAGGPAGGIIVPPNAGGYGARGDRDPNDVRRPWS